MQLSGVTSNGGGGGDGGPCREIGLEEIDYSLLCATLLIQGAAGGWVGVVKKEDHELGLTREG